MTKKQLNAIKLSAVKQAMEQIGYNSRQDYVFEKLDQAIKNDDPQAIYKWEKEASPRTPYEQMILDEAKSILDVYFEVQTKHQEEFENEKQLQIEQEGY